MSSTPGAEKTTDDVRRHYNKSASRYDRQIKFFERILFGDGREWVCSQATGDVLEIAVGVRSPVAAVRAGQRLLEPLFLRLEHDHLTRDPIDHLEPVGFEIESVTRLKWGIVERTVARKPSRQPPGT